MEVLEQPLYEKGYILMLKAFGGEPFEQLSIEETISFLKGVVKYLTELRESNV